MKISFKKIKKLLSAFTAALTVTAIGLPPVFAEGGERAELIAAADSADIVLTMPQAAAEGVSSVQISLNITLNTDNAEITFVPNDKLNAKIQESRYHKDTGILNIYTVGTKPLFNKDDPTITLGTVKLTASSAAGAAANVGFVEDSLKFVRDSSLLTYTNGLTYSEPIKLSVSGGGSSEPPPLTEKPVTTPQEPTPPKTEPPVENGSSAAEETAAETSAAAAEQQPAQSGNEPSVTEQQPDPDVPPAQSSVALAEPPLVIPSDNQPESADFTALSEALTRAESFKAADYTEESFKILQDAIEKAKELMADPAALQDQADEIRMVLENAIGMLSEKGSEPAEEVTGSPAETTSPSDATASDNTPTTTANNDQSGSNQNDSNDEGGFNPLIIVLIIVGVIVIGLAAAIVITLNKKKNSSGKHSK